MSLASFACSKTEDTNASASAPIERSIAATSAVDTNAPGVVAQDDVIAHACASELFRGFPTPQAAFAEYVKAVNAQDWCRAVNAFASEARPELAVITFKMLAMTSGADNPKRDAYLARFRPLCAKYKLNCDSEERAVELARDLLTGMPIDGSEPRLVTVASRVPEDLYSDMMLSLADVDPASMGRFETKLQGFQVQGERATGFAKQQNGRAHPIVINKRANGWMLGLR